MWFDGDRGEIALSIDGRAQPFSNLSAGQRMMLRAGGRHRHQGGHTE